MKALTTNLFRRGAVAALVSLPLLVGALGGSQTTFVHYRNTRWGFCVDYPEGWKSKYGADGSGIFVFPAQQRSDREFSAVEIGARSNQKNSTDASHMEALEDIFKPVPDILSTFGPIEEIRVLAQRRTSFRGIPAISYILSYKQAGETWRSESVVFVSDDTKAVYLLEMRCRLDQYRQFREIYRRMLASFKLDCT
jgi:hypothetical protein